MDRISALLKETLESPLALLPHEHAGTRWPSMAISPDTKPAGPFMSDFSVPQNHAKEVSVACQPPGLWYLVTAVQTD